MNTQAQTAPQMAAMSRPNAFETLFQPEPAAWPAAEVPEPANDQTAARRPNMIEKRRRRRARMMAR